MSRPLKAGPAIALVLALGATIAWLWIMKRDVPALSNTPEVQNVSPRARDFPKAHATESSVLPKDVPVAASSALPATQSDAGARDDSTYFRVLAAMQAVPGAAGQLSPLVAWHESFVLTPDDPDWGRSTEQALREFLQRQSAVGRLEITSISCRSENCEVQLLGDLSDSRSPADEGLMMPPRSLVVDYPVGPSLREQAAIRMGLGDRSGIILMYKRVREEAEATGQGYGAGPSGRS